MFNSKNSEWDSKFIRDAVSVNIGGLSQLRQTMLKYLDLQQTSSGRAHRDYSADINVLASHYLKANMFQLQPGRKQICVASDMFEAGHNKLESGILDQFLARTTLNRAGQAMRNLQEEPETEADVGPEIEAAAEALIMEDGRLVEAEQEVYATAE